MPPLVSHTPALHESERPEKYPDFVVGGGVLALGTFATVLELDNLRDARDANVMRANMTLTASGERAIFMQNLYGSFFDPLSIYKLNAASPEGPAPPRAKIYEEEANQNFNRNYEKYKGEPAVQHIVEVARDDPSDMRLSRLIADSEIQARAMSSQAIMRVESAADVDLTSPVLLMESTAILLGAMAFGVSRHLRAKRVIKQQVRRGMKAFGVLVGSDLG